MSGISKNKILKEYIAFRSLTNHGKAIKDIEFHIKNFITFRNIPVSQINEAYLTAYINVIKEKYSTSNLNSIKSSYIKNFIKWHFEDWSSRFRNLDRILKTEKAQPRYAPEDMITEEKFEKLIHAMDSNYWKAYFLTFFYSGSRPGEICNLKRKDLEFDEEGGCFVTIYSGKHKDVFIKYIPPKPAVYLKEVYNEGHEYVFLNTKTNKPLGVKGAYWKIRKVSEKAIGKKIDLYVLRHSIATILYNKEGYKDDDIARQMGHSISQKKTYQHNDKEELKRVAKKIYVEAEILPEDKRIELEEKIETLEKQNQEYAKHIEKVNADLKIIMAEIGIRKGK